MSQLLFPPSVNALSKQLNANYTNADAIITLSNTTNVQNKPGVVLINRVNSSGEVQPTANWTYIEFTGTSGATLTGCTVISGGQDQALGKVVEFVSDVTQQQRILDALSNVVSATTGALDTTKVVDLTTAQTLTNKTLTSPIINTGISGTAIAAGSDITTGTSNTLIATPKAIKDAGIVALPGAWTSWTPTITVSGGTAPTYGQTFQNYYTQIGKTVFLNMIWYNATGGTAGSGTNGLRFTLPVTASRAQFGGSFSSYEAGGTIDMGLVEVDAQDNAKALFRRQTVSELTGNDQSSAERVIRAYFVYEAA